MHKTVGQSDPRLVWKYVSRIQDNPGIYTAGSWASPVYSGDSWTHASLRLAVCAWGWF